MSAFSVGLAAVLLAGPARCQMTAPAVPPTVSELHERFIQSTDNARKGRILDELSRTPPTATGDVQALFDLFMRFNDSQAREAVLRSLALLSFQNPELDNLFVHYLQQPEAEARIFALKGATRVRDAKALPLIEKLAKKKFPFKTSDEAVLMTEKNEWWVQYAAVEALAQWKGRDYLPDLVKKSASVPEVARIMGTYHWKESFPHFVRWTGSGSRGDQDRGRAGLSAPAPAPDLRATRDLMLAYMRDPKSPQDLRHQLALKIGLTSTSEEASLLLKEYETLTDPQDQLYFRACLFATRDEVVAPLLIKTSREDPSPINRAGALVQLKDLLGGAEMKPLWEWAAQNDPDEGNRELASRELRGLAAAEKKAPSPPPPSPRKTKKAGKG